MIPFELERIEVTVFLSIINQTKFHFIHRKMKTRKLFYNLKTSKSHFSFQFSRKQKSICVSVGKQNALIMNVGL